MRNISCYLSYVTVEVFPTYGKNVLSKYLSYLSSDVLSSFFSLVVIK